MKRVYKILLGIIFLGFLNFANAKSNFEYNPDRVYISKDQIVDNILKDFNLNKTEYKIAHAYLKNGSLSRKNNWDLPIENQQVLSKLFGLKENEVITIMQIDIIEILLNNWNYQNFENLQKIARYTNLYNEKYMQALAKYEKGDFSNLAHNAWYLRNCESLDFAVQKEIVNTLLNGWNKEKYDNIINTLRCVDSTNKDFVLTMAKDEKGDYSKLSNFACTMQFDEELTSLSKEVYLKMDETKRSLYGDKISSFNEYAKWRKDFDPNFYLKEDQVLFIKKYNIDENKKYEIVQNVLVSDKQNKTDEIFKQLNKQYQKEYYQNNKKQILKHRYVDTPKLALKCLVNPSAHLNNYINKRRNNAAFAVGLLNPINIITSIVTFPMFVINEALP